ncbi:MAG: YggS family pyridoxal phosphate-dependent enzyme [bacterium]|nr:YggS family pyridoxal phosphate-dependent enzyme [bacterium]
MLKRKLKKVKGPLSKDITLLAVTKTVDLEWIKEIIEAGALDLGENKVQEGLDKFYEIEKVRQELEVQAKAYGDAEFLENYRNLRWHFIGHLQKNKVKKALEFAYLIHSVESLSLLQSINKHARQLKKIQNILIQVNTSGEESKFGLSETAAVDFLEKLAGNENEYCSNVKILGIMTMAPLTENECVIRDCFKKAKLLFDNFKKEYFGYDFIDFKYLSMGMSSDYQLAIEEGSNMVRVGSAIFGERVKPV